MNRMGLALACAVAVGVVGAVLAVKSREETAPQPVVPSVAAVADAGPCTEEEAPVPPLLPAAESAPVLVSAAGEVKVKIDGAFFESRADAPKSLTPGPHQLAVDLDGVRLTLKFEVAPFRAALFHVEDTPGVGLPTVVYLGARCTNCAEFPRPPLSPGDPGPRRADDEEPLPLAAQALMTSDLKSALSALKEVPKAQRETPLYLRLWAHVQQSTGQGAAALTSLRLIPAPKSNGLAPMVAAWVKLDEKERAREPELPVKRWNLVTERYSRFVDRFYAEAPGPVNVANARFNELTLAFTAAAKAKDLKGMQDTLEAADTVVLKLVSALRTLRTGDCEYQRRIVGAF